MFVRVVVIVAVLAVAVAWGARRSDGAGSERSYVVRVGDTLWTIAATHYGGDPRDAVWRLEERNRLPDSGIRPGEVLVLP